MNSTVLDINKIKIDGGTQPRENIDEGIVREYAEAMQEGDKFPPIVVFNDGANYWLADGFHRYHASRKLTFKEIEAQIKQGTKRDAVLYSVSANAKHGLRRTNADKRKAVLTLLNDEEWSQWSDREIARRCEVHHDTVGKYRKELTGENRQIESTRKVKRNGTEYTVDTSNIGNSKKGSDIPDNVNPETGEVFEDEETLTKQVPQEGKNGEPKSKGIGLQKAHEAIAKLKQIPPNDGLLQEGYDTVIKWIKTNR